MKDKFIKSLSMKKKSKDTMKSILFAINLYHTFLGNKLEDSTEDDLLDFVQYLRDEGNAESSIDLYKSKLRQFFKYCDEQTEEIKYRKFVKLLKGQIKGQKLTPQQILSVEEIKKLINVAGIEQDRLIVAALFESGMRIGEFVSLKISNVEIKDKDVIFYIPDEEGCKTGSRTIHCVELSGYVQDWLKCHTFYHPDSQFIQLKPEAIRNHLKKLAKRAQITKRMNPHSLRHAAITRSAMMGMTDIDMSFRYWGCAHSDMLDVYIHLSKEMNSDSYKRLMGINTEESKIKNSIVSTCVECGKQIPSGSLCKQCDENKTLKAKIEQMEHGKKESDEKFKHLENEMQEQRKIMMEVISNVATFEIGKEILKDVKKD